MGQNYAVVSLLLIGCLGCQLRVPSVPEQQALAERGTFTTGAPAWLYRGVTGAGAPSERDSGIVPSTYAAPGIVGGTALPVGVQEDQALAVLPSQRDNIADEEPPAPTSAIDRVLQTCPGIAESDLSDAIATVELSVQVEKYEQLTRRCRTSADLWLWLAKDYVLQNRDVEANRSLERVLVLEPGNAEARDILSTLRREEADAPAQ